MRTRLFTIIMTVIDPIMDRVLKRSDNAPYDYVGITAPMGKVPAMAALLDCSDERIGRVRNFAGIDHDVFATPEQIEALKDKRVPERALSADEIVAYLREQMRGAETEKDRDATMALMVELSQNDSFSDLRGELSRILN